MRGARLGASCSLAQPVHANAAAREGSARTRDAGARPEGRMEGGDAGSAENGVVSLPRPSNLDASP